MELRPVIPTPEAHAHRCACGTIVACPIWGSCNGDIPAVARCSGCWWAPTRGRTGNGTPLPGIYLASP